MGPGRARFVEDTSGFGKVALDTNACIYYLSNEPSRADLITDLIVRAVEGSIEIELPGIVRFELLVRPYRSGNMSEMLAVRQLTGSQPGVRTTPLSDLVVFASAEVRAMTRLKAPDALVAGSAAVSGCEAVIGNDRQFGVLNRLQHVQLMTAGSRRLMFPRYLQLDDYVDGDVA